MKQIMSVITFRSTEVIKTIKLERQKTVTSNWYTTKFLLEILLEVDVRRLMLHHDNEFSHITRSRVEFLPGKLIKVIVRS